jgi:hypothetical protein
MSAPIARGYRTLAKSQVHLSDWRLLVDGEGTSGLPDRLLSWTMFSSMAITVDVNIDLADALSTLDLHPTAQLGAVLRWRADSTYLSGAADVQRVDDGLTALQLELDGFDLGGRLTLGVDIVVLEPGLPTESTTAPRVRGAIVWHDAHTLMLEGNDPQMPMVMVPFSSRFTFAPNAVWHVEFTQSDLDSPASAAFVVWLNSEDEAIRALAEHDASERAHVLTLIGIGVYQRIIEHALQEFEVADLEMRREPGTFGELARNLILLVADSVQDAVSNQRSAPGEFHLRVQSRIGSAL